MPGLTRHLLRHARLSFFRHTGQRPGISKTLNRVQGDENIFRHTGQRPLRHAGLSFLRHTGLSFLRHAGQRPGISSVRLRGGTRNDDNRAHNDNNKPEMCRYGVEIHPNDGLFCWG